MKVFPPKSPKYPTLSLRRLDGKICSHAHVIVTCLSGPIYTGRIIRLGGALAKNGSYGLQADGSIHPSTRAIAVVRLVRRTIVDNSSRWMIPLPVGIYTQTELPFFAQARPMNYYHVKI